MESTNPDLPSFFKDYSVQSVNITELEHPVFMRMNTSDPFAFAQVFEQKQYYLNPLPFVPRLIIDGGANVGYGSIWFSYFYPRAKVIAVEPDSSNFEVLKYNTMHYKNIEPICSGLWPKDTYLEVKDIGLDKWGMVVEETNQFNPLGFKALTIHSLLANSEFDEIDILKLDIEGAEKELFTEGYENWMRKVKIIIIELHDRMKFGCSAAFFKAMSNYSFGFVPWGENLIFIRDDFYFDYINPK